MSGHSATEIIFFNIRPQYHHRCSYRPGRHKPEKNHTKIAFYEDCTHASGIVRPSFNNNRNSDIVPETQITDCAGGGDDGTQIFYAEFGTDSGIGVNKVVGGGISRGDTEWNLKQNTKYLVKITSLSDSLRGCRYLYGRRKS